MGDFIAGVLTDREMLRGGNCRWRGVGGTCACLDVSSTHGLGGGQARELRERELCRRGRQMSEAQRKVKGPPCPPGLLALELELGLDGRCRHYY